MFSVFVLESDMNRFLLPSATWRIIAGVVLVAAAGVRPSGQAPVGAAQRPPARQNAPLIVMSPKAKSPGWTGVHRPHTRLVDVVARHKNQKD